MASVRSQVWLGALLSGTFLATFASGAQGDRDASAPLPANRPVKPPTPKRTSTSEAPVRTVAPRPRVTPMAPAKATAKPTDLARQPKRDRSDTGKTTKTRSAPSESGSKASKPDAIPGEDVMAPLAPPALAPAAFVPAAAPLPAAPPERPVALPESLPQPKEEPAPAQPPAPEEQPGPPLAKSAAAAEAIDAPPERPSPVEASDSEAASQSATTPAPLEKPSAGAEGSRVPPLLPASPAPVPVPGDDHEPIVLDVAVFDQIRLEIKSRLPYFQACADAARRRGAADVRRVQATWCIAADGVIKELRLEGALDAQFATCITRMGSRPFDAKPGAELVIPTPIVFVR
jgi:hypothetical protein